MGESKDELPPSGSDKFDADGNPTAKFRGDVHAARFALKLLRAVGKRGIVVPDPKVVEAKIAGAATLLSEFRYTSDVGRFDDEVLTLTDEEVAAYQGPPERLKMLQRLRHPKRSKANKAEIKEYQMSKEQLEAFIAAETLRIANEMEGKRVVPVPGEDGTRTVQGEPARGPRRIALVHQSRAVKMAAQLIAEGADDEKYAQAQRVVQAMLYIDTMSKLATDDTQPQEAPTSDGFVQGATLRDADTKAGDASRDETADHIEEAMSKRGKPNSKPIRERATSLDRIAREQVGEADQLTTLAGLLKEKDRKKLTALLQPIRPQFHKFENALGLSMRLTLKVDVADKDIDLQTVPEADVTQSFEQAEQHEGRLKTIDGKIREIEATLDEARAFYAENSEISATLRKVMFHDLVKEGDDGNVKRRDAALTGTGEIKSKKSALPQGPLKDIVAKYNTIRALEDAAASDPDSRAMVDKLQREVNREVSFLEKNIEKFEEIEDLIEDYEKNLARKRWAYDAKAHEDLEKDLDDLKDDLNKARTTEDLDTKVLAPLTRVLGILKEQSVPDAGKRRKRAEKLQKDLDKFEKKHLKPLGEAMHDYAERFDIAYTSAAETVEEYAEKRDSKADRKKLKTAAEDAEKKTRYKGKFDIEYQRIRGSLRISDPKSVETQEDLLADLTKRVDDKTTALKAQIPLVPTSAGYDDDLAKDVAIDIMFSEREAGRIATIEPLLKDRVKKVEKLLASNKKFAPQTDKATFDSLSTRLKSLKARMKAAKSSEEFNALWEDLRGIDEERLASRGAAKIDKEEDIGKIVKVVIEAEEQLNKQLRGFFTDLVAPEGRYAATRIGEGGLEQDTSLETMAKYCDPQSPDEKKTVIDKFTTKLADILEKRSLQELFDRIGDGFEAGASDVDRRDSKEGLLADLRWRRELVVTSAHGLKLRVNPFDGGDHVHAFLRVLQAAEGQIMAKVK